MVVLPSDRVASGVRVSSSLYSSYKRLCLVQRVRPNEVVEAAMAAAVMSGDLRAFLKQLGRNDAEQVVVETDLNRTLDELERLVGTGWFQLLESQEGRGEWPNLNEQVDELMRDAQELLPRTHDPRLIAKARDRLSKATVYFAMERWAGTAGSPQANLLREAYEKLSESKQIHQGITEPVRLDLHEHANASAQNPAKKA